MNAIFDKDKTLNAVLYITKRIKRSDFHKVFKILYFADREHLSKYADLITGDTYIAMTDGPVPSNLYDILKSVRGDSFFKNCVDFSEIIDVVNWDIIIAKKDPDMDYLSQSNIEVLDETIDKYGDLSWDEIREKSHDYAWRSTISNKPIAIRNIILESGNDEDYADYIEEELSFEQCLKA